MNPASSIFLLMDSPTSLLTPHPRKINHTPFFKLYKDNLHWKHEFMSSLYWRIEGNYKEAVTCLLHCYEMMPSVSEWQIWRRRERGREGGREGDYFEGAQVMSSLIVKTKTSNDIAQFYTHIRLFSLPRLLTPFPRFFPLLLPFTHTCIT